MHQQSAELVILFIRHQAQRPVTERGFTCLGGHQTAFADRPHPVDVALQSRAAVENIDVVQVAEPLFLQHRPGRGGLRMNLADHRLCLRGKEIDIQRMLGHQGGNESLLSGAAQVVGTGKLHGEKAFAQALPERRVALLVNHPAHLGDHLLIEALAKGGHK